MPKWLWWWDYSLDFVSPDFGQKEFEYWKRVRRIGFLPYLLLFGVAYCGFVVGPLFFLIFGAAARLAGDRWELEIEGVFTILYWVIAGTAAIAVTWWTNEKKYRWYREGRERERQSKKPVNRGETKEPIALIPMAQRVSRDHEPNVFIPMAQRAEATDQRVNNANRGAG